MKGEGWAPSAVPKIQWASNPHCPYDYKAVGNLYSFKSVSFNCLPGLTLIVASGKFATYNLVCKKLLPGNSVVKVISRK